VSEEIDRRNTFLRGVHLLDGGLASELEYQGARIDIRKAARVA
jgi:hypothetical protein